MSPDYGHPRAPRQLGGPSLSNGLLWTKMTDSISVESPVMERTSHDG